MSQHVVQQAELVRAQELAKERLQQAEAAGKQAAAAASYVSPELARGDMEDMQMGIRLSDENQRLAAEVATLRLQLEETIARPSPGTGAGEGQARQVGDCAAPHSPADGQRPAAASVDGVPRTGNDDGMSDPEERRREVVSSRLEENELAEPGSFSNNSPEKSGESSRNSHVPTPSYRSSSVRHEATIDAGIQALLATPRSSEGEYDKLCDSGVRVSSSSSSSDGDFISNKVPARQIEQEAEEILAKLKAHPPPEWRALLQARLEVEKFAAVARARCNEIRRLPRPMPKVLQLPPP